MSDVVLVERYGRRGELVLNRPERKNALTGPLVEGLIDGLLELDADPEVGAILIRGAGGSFCAGLDLKEFRADPAPAWRETFGDRWREFHALVFEAKKPVVGALERYAIAGGSGLAFACDLLVMGEGAFLHVSEAEMGVAAPMNVAWLQLKGGATVVYEAVFVAKRMAAADLLRLGLVAQVAADDQVLEETRALVDRLANFPGHPHAATKGIVQDLLGRQVVQRQGDSFDIRDWFRTAQDAASREVQRSVSDTDTEAPSTGATPSR